jgi:hydrogenase nickel incorporation protein HypB
MCSVCGCGTAQVRVDGREIAPGEAREHDYVHAGGTIHEHRHDHGQAHGQEHGHAPDHSRARLVRVEQDILARNDRYAAQNRRRLADHGVFALNLVSSPGSGKTTLLVRTIEAMSARLPVAVIEGDQQTSIDAERIRAAGARAIQINTGKGCHLDAHTVGHAIDALAPPEGALLLIENVGNLVCPSAFDLGEAHKVVVLSVTEGEDKPLKYPDMFRAASVMLLNKVDLLPHLRFDLDAVLANAHRVNPRLRVIRVSAITGEGLEQWLDWLEEGVDQTRRRAAANVAALRARIAELEARLAAAGG